MRALRLFVAVPVEPPPLLERWLEQSVSQRGRAFRAGRGRVVRWKPLEPQGLHITLKFLGAVAEGRLAEVAAAMDRGLAGASLTAFKARLEGLAQFPPGARQPARVVYVPLREGGALVRAAAALDAAFAELTPPFESESRSFKPHLTVARTAPVRGRVQSSDPEDLDAWLAPHRATPWGEAAIRSVHLFASELLPRGPVYRSLHRVDLVASR